MMDNYDNFDENTQPPLPEEPTEQINKENSFTSFDERIAAAHEDTFISSLQAEKNADEVVSAPQENAYVYRAEAESSAEKVSVPQENVYGYHAEAEPTAEKVSASQENPYGYRPEAGQAAYKQAAPAQGNPYTYPPQPDNRQPNEWRSSNAPNPYAYPPVNGQPPQYAGNQPPAPYGRWAPPQGQNPPPYPPQYAAPPSVYPAQPYPPYQYNSNRGWQTAPPEQAGYKWNYDEYAKVDRKKEGKSSRSGLKVFVLILGIPIVIAIVTAAITNNYGDFKMGFENGLSAGEEDARDDIKMDLDGRPSPDIYSSPTQSGDLLTIPQVAKAVLPSVVGIISYRNSDFSPNGYGSGIVMTEDGYIITNAHVVEDGQFFEVQFNRDEDSEFEAKLIGTDSVTDLAVLKITSAVPLQAAVFGDSDKLEVGETLVAIGNPAGDTLASTVTVGYVSALNRVIEMQNYTMTYIQTDAAINPGNSGGALANQYGQIIGINSSKVIAQGYEGIGFAIPISLAKPIIEEIIREGRVTGRVMLGITCSQIDAVTAYRNEIPMGLLVESVDNVQLSRAGVIRRDILTHIDGTEVRTLGDVRKILDTHKVGDTVTLKFYRRTGSKERRFEAEITLTEG